MASSIPYLLEGTEDLVVEEGKLPSNGEVVSFLIYHYERKKREDKSRDFCKVVTPMVLAYYDKVGIVTRLPTNATEKIFKVFDKYLSLKANRHTKNRWQKSREEDFLLDCKNLCDVSLVEALEKITDTEVRNFLEMQRQKGRPGSMVSILAKRKKSGTTSIPITTAITPGPDTSVLSSTAKSDDSRAESSTLASDESKVESSIDASVQSIASSLSSISVVDKKDPDYFDERVTPKQTKQKMEVIDERIAAAMDKCGVSGPCATHLCVAFLLKFGFDPKEYNISYNTIINRRAKFREEIYDGVRDSVVIGRGAVVHFDGKLMSAITGSRTKKVDRLAIKVTYRDVDQLIGVPICDSTGLGIASTVYQSLKDWKLINYIDACCFDTTGTNTGSDNGAAIFLEQFLNRSLVHFPCRHHIFELILKLFFETKVTTSSGPNVALFERFQKKWDDIDQSRFDAGIDVPEIKSSLDGIIKSSMHFLEQQIQKERSKKSIRADYYEFLELAVLFLGGKLQKKSFQVLFHPPGALHHARWMAKALYSLKIYLFRKQFELTSSETRGLAAVNVFLVRYYIKNWFQCSNPCTAARLDLQFVQEMIAYIKNDAVMAKLILGKFSKHLWYLSEETVGMAFFDEKISNSIKARMVKNLRLTDPDPSSSSSDPDESTSSESRIDSDGEKSREETGSTTSEFEFNFEEEDESFVDVDEDESVSEEESDVSIRQPDEFDDCQHRIIVDLDELINTYAKKDVADFVTRKTYQFFKRFEIPTSFLQIPTAKWSLDSSYQAAKEIVMTIKVVNDTAERGVQLMSNYNNLLTKNEKLKQFILQVVAYYRKKFPTWHIKDLVKK